VCGGGRGRGEREMWGRVGVGERHMEWGWDVRRDRYIEELLRFCPASACVCARAFLRKDR